MRKELKFLSFFGLGVFSYAQCSLNEVVVRTECYTAFITYYMSASTGKCEKSEQRIPTGYCVVNPTTPPQGVILCDYDVNGNGPYNCSSGGGSGGGNPNVDPCDRDSDGNPSPGCNEGPGGLIPEN